MPRYPHHHHLTASSSPAPSPGTGSSSTLINLPLAPSSIAFPAIIDADLPPEDGENLKATTNSSSLGSSLVSVVSDETCTPPLPALSPPRAPSSDASAQTASVDAPVSSPPVAPDAQRVRQPIQRPIPPPIQTTPYPSQQLVYAFPTGVATAATTGALSARGFVQPHVSHLPRRARVKKNIKEAVNVQTPTEEVRPTKENAGDDVQKDGILLNTSDSMGSSIPIPAAHPSAPSHPTKEEFVRVWEKRGDEEDRSGQRQTPPMKLESQSPSMKTPPPPSAPLGMNLPRRVKTPRTAGGTPPRASNIEQRMTERRSPLAPPQPDPRSKFSSTTSSSVSSSSSSSSRGGDRGEGSSAVAGSPSQGDRVGRSRSRRPRRHVQGYAGGAAAAGGYGDRARSMGRSGPSGLRFETYEGEEDEPVHETGEGKVLSARLRGTQGDLKGKTRVRVQAEDGDSEENKRDKERKSRGVSLPPRFHHQYHKRYRPFVLPQPGEVGSSGHTMDSNVDVFSGLGAAPLGRVKWGGIEGLEDVRARARENDLFWERDREERGRGRVRLIPGHTGGRGGKKGKGGRGMRLQNVDGFLGLGGDECEVEVGFLSCEEEDDEGVFWGVCDDEKKEVGQEGKRKQLGAVVKREVVVEFYSMSGRDGKEGEDEETEEPHRRVVLPLLYDLTQYRDGVPVLFSNSSSSSVSTSSMQDLLDGFVAGVKEMMMSVQPHNGKTRTKNRVRVLAPSARREDGMSVALGICLFLSTLADASPASPAAQDEQLDAGEGGPGQREAGVPKPPSHPLVEDPAEDALYTPVHKAWMRMMDELEVLRLAEEEEEEEEMEVDGFVFGDDGDADVDVVGLDEPHSPTRKIQVKKERAMKEGVRPEWRGVLSYEGLMCVWEGVQRWM